MTAGRWIGLRAAVLALALAPVAAGACSVVKGYRVPTNFELVRDADLIVVGTVVPDKPYRAGSEDEPTLRLKPVRFLKGGPTARHLTLGGMLELPRGGETRSFRPVYTRLDEAHPSVWLGACSRQFYAPETLVVAMFREDGDQWVQYSPPFARAIEDVPDADRADWVRAAELYVRIAAMPAAARAGALRAEQAKLAGSETPADRDLVRDIVVALNPKQAPAPDLFDRNEALGEKLSADLGEDD